MDTFDNGKTWEDVRRRLINRLYRKFPGVYTVDIFDDAASEAILDLGAYWRKLPSARDADGNLVFNFAVQRGEWVAVQHVLDTLRFNDTTLHMDTFGLSTDRGVANGGGNRTYSPDDEDTSDAPLMEIVDPSPGPEELAIEADEQTRARAMLADMTPDELEDFFKYLGDDPVPVIAEKLGVSERTVQRRRAAKRLDLRYKAQHYGLTA